MKKTDLITDLHCHILPGIDDGAPDINVSVALLQEELRQNVKQIVFTPHFWSWEKTQKEFLVDRLNAAKEIYELLDRMGIHWSAGAELRITPELMKMNLKKFCFVDTDYILLEWPFTQYPLYGEELVFNQIRQGMRPIFAHLERYDYFWNDPEELETFIDAGVLCHINAGALIHRSTRKQALKLIREGYIHFICSDCHNMEARPPRLLEAYEILEKELGRDWAFKLMENADKVFHNAEVEAKIRKEQLFGLFRRG